MSITSHKLPSDLEIARRAKMLPIAEIAEKLGIGDGDLEHYGKYKAKVSLDLYHRLDDAPTGKLVLVTAITPTPAGEGKTTTSIGLCDGLEPHRQAGQRLPARAVDGPVLRHERRRGRRRLRPGRAHGGHQPPLHRRLPRHRTGPQPAGGHARQPHPPRQRPRHRSAADRLEARGRHERPGLAEHHRGPGRHEQLRAARERASTSPWPPK